MLGKKNQSGSVFEERRTAVVVEKKKRRHGYGRGFWMLEDGVCGGDVLGDACVQSFISEIDALSWPYDSSSLIV